MNYEKMTKAELIKALKSLQSTKDQPAETLQRTMQELQVHQIELEMQNRELLEVQRELEVSRQRYANLYDFAPVGYVTLDGNGLIREINVIAAKMLGLGKSQLIGSPFFLWVAEHERQRFWHHLHQCSGANEKATAELRLQERHGESRMVELSGVVVHDSESNGFSYRTAIFDITKRKQMENALRESEERFRSIFENAPVGVTTATPDIRWIQVNPAFCRFLGYTEGELLERTVADVIHPDDLDETHRQIREFISGERQTIDLEKRYVRKDGATVWGHATATWVVDSAGKPRYSVGLTQDITERKWAEVQLMQTSKLAALGELAAGVAHEVLNPHTSFIVLKNGLEKWE